jgi:hypothetical protein
MMVVCASERPRSAIISTRSRRLSLNRRYQRTHRRMTSRSKWPVAAHEQLFQALQCQSAPLRYSAFSERPVSIATARTSPDGHLLQLAFEVHGLRGSGRGLILQWLRWHPGITAQEAAVTVTSSRRYPASNISAAVFVSSTS